MISMFKACGDPYLYLHFALLTVEMEDDGRTSQAISDMIIAGHCNGFQYKDFLHMDVIRKGKTKPSKNYSTHFISCHFRTSAFERS